MWKYLANYIYADQTHKVYIKLVKVVQCAIIGLRL